MDGQARTAPGADFGDRVTYGEVELATRSVGSILDAADWRVFEPLVRKPRKPAGPKLYRHSRTGTLEQERKRAHGVVSVARAAVVETFAAARAGMPIEVAPLLPVIEAIAASIKRHPRAIADVARAKTRSDYTYLHSVSVCGLMIGLAQQMRLDPDLIPAIGLAGMLHDIGKAAVPQALLDKPGPLTDAEFAEVQRHPELGDGLLATSTDLPDLVRDVVLHHHERLDGTGYPDRLIASDQSIYARMATICDVYDAVTSVRPYQDSWSPGEAIEWMRSTRGQFDPVILAAFVKMLGAFPPGTLVRLNSDRLAVVCDEPDADPLYPHVTVFHCAMFDRPIAAQRVWSISDPVLCVERPENWRFRDWSATRDMLMAHHD